MRMSKENYETLKSFFDYFMPTANDAAAEYIIDVLAAACKAAADYCEQAKTKNKKVYKA